jgi:microcystin-dependent protein
MDFFIAGIILFGGTFAPRDWAMCNGQIISISQNQALFALLGTTYGGDGRTTFGIPDLRGRTPIGFGTGPGLPTFHQGMHAGTISHTMNTNEMANHSHTATISDITVAGTINVSEEGGNTNDPAGAYLAKPLATHKIYNTTKTGTSTLAADALTISGSGGTVTVDPTGNQQAFSLMQPSISMNYIMAMQGVFPSRN